MHEEIRQLLSGHYDGDKLKAIIPRAADLITAQTAYGPRVAEQLEFVEQELRESPMSRRAVIYVGDRQDSKLKDVEALTAGEMPCTCVLQYFVRDNLLHATTYMRSWDLVWGLSYDVPSFVAIQMALAKALNLELGYYTHHAGSAHIYERHFDIKVWPNHVGLVLPWLRPSIKETREVAASLVATV